MSVFSQNRVYAFTEEGIQANQQQPTEVDTKAPAQGITPNQSTDSSGEEVTLNKEIDDQGKEVTESLDVEYDPEMCCEMLDQYIDENYNDMDLALYVTEMQTKMDQTLDAIFENFTLISEADDEGEQKESEDGGSQEQQTQNAGPQPDNQAKLGGHVAGKAELVGIKIKDLIQKILAKIKEVIGKIGAKIKEFATKFAEDLKAFYAVDAATYLIYSKALDKVNPDKFNAEFPGVQVNKYLFESIIKEKALGLVGGYDFKSFLQPLYDGKIDVKNMKKPQVEEANKKFNDELKDAVNKFDETIKGYNEKPELVKCTLGEVQVITLAYGDSIVSNDSKFVGVEKNYKKMADSSMQILDNMSKAAQEMLDKVTTENQDEDSDIVFAARSLYKNTTDCTMACGKAIVQIGKYNLKKLNTCRRVYISAGKWCKGEGKKKPEAVAASADMSIGTNNQVLTESPLAAGIAVMSAFYLVYFTGVFKLASKLGLEKINKALHVYEKNNKGNADFVKFSDLDKETVKKSGDQDEKKETISSKIANVFGKGTDNDTIDIYKDKSGNEVFSVSYKKKLGGDSRDKIQFTMMDDKRKDFAAYYIACVTTKKFGYTSTKIDNWANNILTTDTSGVVANEATDDQADDDKSHKAQELFKDAMKSKMKEKLDKGEVYSVNDIDEWAKNESLDELKNLYGEVTAESLTEEYNHIMSHLQLMNEIDQYVGIDESVVMEGKIFDKIKEIAGKIIEKIKEFITKLKIFVLERIKSISEKNVLSFTDDKDFEFWKGCKIKCNEFIFNNLSSGAYHGDKVFKKFREDADDVVYAVDNKIWILKDPEEIKKALDEQYNQYKEHIDKLNKEMKEKLGHIDDAAVTIEIDTPEKFKSLISNITSCYFNNTNIFDADSISRTYSKNTDAHFKEIKANIEELANSWIKKNEDRIGEYNNVNQEAFSANYTKIITYLLSTVSEVFMKLEKYQSKIILEHLKIYMQACHYANKNKKNAEKEEQSDNSKESGTISDEFKKAVDEGKTLRVRIMLKDACLLYKKDKATFLKYVKYAESNMDDLYIDDAENFSGSPKTEDEYDEFAVDLVNKFNKHNLMFLYNAGIKIFDK